MRSYDQIKEHINNINCNEIYSFDKYNIFISNTKFETAFCKTSLNTNNERANSTEM